MNYFGQHEQEQAMQRFIHDSNQRLSWIDMYANKILTTSDFSIEIKDRVNAIQNAKKSLEKVIDEYLKKWEKFPLPIPDFSGVDKAKEWTDEDIINAWNSAYGGDSFHDGKDYLQSLKQSPEKESI